jgi:hypothetical protein
MHFYEVLVAGGFYARRMSEMVLLYLRAAALLLIPCVLMLGTIGYSQFGRMAAGALLAASWPLAIPLTLIVFAVRLWSGRDEPLSVIRPPEVIPPAASPPEPVAAER